MTGFVFLAADQQLPEDVGTSGPLGLLRPPQAYRRSLTNIVTGGPPLFWNVRRG